MQPRQLVARNSLQLLCLEPSRFPLEIMLELLLSKWSFRESKSYCQRKKLVDTVDDAYKYDGIHFARIEWFRSLFATQFHSSDINHLPSNAWFHIQYLYSFRVLDNAMRLKMQVIVSQSELTQLLLLPPGRQKEYLHLETTHRHNTNRNGIHFIFGIYNDTLSFGQTGDVVVVRRHVTASIRLGQSGTHYIGTTN